MNEIFDTIVIGGGPAGLTAGIYLGRGGAKALLMERLACGGQALTASLIENFPGFPDGINGPELIERFTSQAKKFGLRTEAEEAKGLAAKRRGAARFEVKTVSGKAFQALSIVIATGARWNKLGAPGEEALAGRGVSYCATCDGPLFRGREVVVVGGGDTALEDALFLTKFAEKVTVVHRRDNLRAARILQERAFANKRIKFCLSSAVDRILGSERVEGVAVKNTVTKEETTLKADGVFVLVGTSPNSEFVKGVVETDGVGCIVTDEGMMTSQEGIFACGDVRKKNLRQIVTAAGEGAQAAVSACHYVDRLKGVEYK